MKRLSDGVIDYLLPILTLITLLYCILLYLEHHGSILPLYNR